MARRRHGFLRAGSFLSSVVRILRHNQGFMQGRQWVPIEELLAEMKHRVTEDELRAMVASQTRPRVSMDTRFVWANYGHTFSPQPNRFTLIRAAGDLAYLGHATTVEGLRLIRESGALKRMDRAFVHLAASREALPANREVVLWANVEALLKEGIPLYRTEGDVVLCPKDIPLKFLVVIKHPKKHSL